MGGSKRAATRSEGGKLRVSKERSQPRDSVAAKAGTKQGKALRPAQCRTYLRRELASSFPAIVRGFVKQAESGSVQHLKLTTELLEKPAKKRRGKGSAQLLMEKLERMEQDGMAGAEEPVDEAWPE